MKEIEEIQESPGDPNTSRLLEKAAASGYARPDLDRLFTYLGQSNRRLILLLDEFERLLMHRNFQDAANEAYKNAPDRRNITRWMEKDKKERLPTIFWRLPNGGKATHLCLFLAWLRLRRYCGV